MTPELLTQAAIGMLTVNAVEFMKRSRFFPWMRYDTTHIAKFLSHFMAIVTAVGISVTHAGGMMDGGSLTIAWPPAQDLFKMFATYVTSQGGQTLFYEMAIKPKPQYLSPSRGPEPMRVARRLDGGGSIVDKGSE